MKKWLEARPKGKARAIRYVEHFESGGDAILKSACKLSLEGIVSKKLGAPYRSGRSESWTKAKCRAGQEVVLGGWKTTNGKFRSLMAGVYRGDHLAFVGMVGTGFGQDKVKRIMPALKANASDKSPFGGKDAPRKTRDVHWLKPELVAEIEFAGFTDGGNIRQAAFKGLRQDKPADEIVAEKPAMTKHRQACRNQTRARSAQGAGHASGERIRRGDGRRHLEARQGAVAGRRRRQGRDQARSRPLFRGGRRLDDRPSQGAAVLDRARARRHRWREVLSAPRACRAPRTCWSWSRSPATASPICRSTASRGWRRWRRSAASNCIPGIARPMRHDMPGRLVFDLDPAPDVEFADVIEAAKEMRQRLADIGMESFCKTTGGKGLHVVAPLASRREGQGDLEGGQSLRAGRLPVDGQ